MTAIVHPTSLINEYLSEKVIEAIPDSFSAQSIKFFPTLPTSIDAVTEDFPDSASDVFAIYDRMFKSRNKVFPHIKSEQTVYYFYKMNNLPDALFETMQVVYDLMDREDETAEEINEWMLSKIDAGVVNIRGKDIKPVRFHRFKMYQLQETRDVSNFGTTRSYVASKIIIEYEYSQI